MFFTIRTVCVLLGCATAFVMSQTSSATASEEVVLKPKPMSQNEFKDKPAASGVETVIEPKPLVQDQVSGEIVPGSLSQTTELVTGEQQPGSEEQKRDPFAVTGELVTQNNQPVQKRVSSSGHVFTPKQEIKLPQMSLRGHLKGNDGVVIALLQIGKGQVHIVREGDTIGLHEFGLNTVVRVKKISRLQLIIESGSLGQLIIVR